MKHVAVGSKVGEMLTRVTLFQASSLKHFPKGDKAFQILKFEKAAAF